MFTKMQFIAPLTVQDYDKRELGAQVSVDSDESTIQITCWNAPAAKHLMELARNKELVVKIEEQKS